ncbi:hypothetical protein [Ramlibacter sp. AN1133]|uniref:hypothetical protein n=1 Tax=Ramlibacter sp. AN1133 TaxID=3133429 RepID=UPI0030BFED13
MHLIASFTVIAAVLLAGCASQDPLYKGVAAGTGKHLVYRDTAGKVIRQFDYPDDAICRRVETLAGRTARCQETPASGFQARATLRYNPPGMLVQGHYADMARCRADTGVMSAGVELINPCTTQ